MINLLISAAIALIPYCVYPEQEPNNRLPGNYGGPHAVLRQGQWWPGLDACGKLTGNDDIDIFHFDLGFPTVNAVHWGVPLAVYGTPGKLINVMVMQFHPTLTGTFIFEVIDIKSGVGEIHFGTTDYYDYPPHKKLWYLAIWGEEQEYNIKGY